MNILIINSPLFREKNDRYDEDSLPPLGLGYIATHLKEKGHDVLLLDAIEKNMPVAEVVSFIETLKPQVLAINIFTTNYGLVKDIIEGLTVNLHIIIGGLSTKDLYSKIFNWSTPNKIDVVFGDGELICEDLVEGDLKQTPLAENGNRRAFKIDATSPYYVHDLSLPHLDRSFFINEPVVHPLGFIEANIVASRGCIYNCAFCAAASSVNREFGTRERSVHSIQDELDSIRKELPMVNSIRVLDDLFLKNSRNIYQAIEAFSPYSFQWRSMAHVMTFNRVEAKTLLALRKSGCRELFIGVESGSPKILKAIHKTPNPTTIKKNLESVMRAGISLKTYFIYGFPEEDIEDMELTFLLASSLREMADKYKVDFRTSVFQFRPYNGTELHHQLAKDGQIEEDVKSVEPNTNLSDKIGRLQFNFHSGNYSNVASEVVYDYIYRTTNLSCAKYLDAISQNKPISK
tara:strand:- start:14596 stop:15975 length:1380 start_codon:yes stop_codon:yes gene_type:complete